MKYLALFGAIFSLFGLIYLVLFHDQVVSYDQEPTLATSTPIPRFVIASTTKAEETTSTSTTVQEDTPHETAEPATAPVLPSLPQGTIRHPSGGLARAGCEAIADPDPKKACTEDRAIAQYIYSIVPNAQITKGYCLPGTAFDDPQNWNWCTDLNNLQTKTVHALQGIFQKIIGHCRQYGIADCAIIVTGGSELGHRGEVKNPDGSITCVDQESHCGGKKIDLRLTKGLESLITTQFTKLPNRDFDNAPQWVDTESGYIYAKEPTHWDILVP